MTRDESFSLALQKFDAEFPNAAAYFRRERDARKGAYPQTALSMAFDFFEAFHGQGWNDGAESSSNVGSPE